jgi:hypothetical protein
MSDTIYTEWLASDDQGLWEQAYLNYVAAGKVAVDEWILEWLKNRIKLPASKDYSLFSPNELINEALMGVKIKLIVFSKVKDRILRLEVYRSGDYHPYYEISHSPDALNSRFESIGNPIIDTPNYRCWEEYLFYKLFSEILFDEGGLDAIIEGVHSHH